MVEVRAVASSASGGASARVTGVEMSHFLWLDWGNIARSQLEVVRAARDQVLKVRAENGNWAVDMAEEHNGSLVTISAVAHALDGIYGELIHLVPALTFGDSAGRHDKIRTTLHSAFKTDNDTGKYWSEEFTWLHDLRDAAVHPSAKLRPSEPHPIEGHGSYEAARYCLENCERAMRLFVNVLERFLVPEKIKVAAVKDYGARMAGPIESLIR